MSKTRSSEFADAKIQTNTAPATQFQRHAGGSTRSSPQPQRQQRLPAEGGTQTLIKIRSAEFADARSQTKATSATQ